MNSIWLTQYEIVPRLAPGGIAGCRWRVDCSVPRQLLTFDSNEEGIP